MTHWPTSKKAATLYGGWAPFHLLLLVVLIQTTVLLHTSNDEPAPKTQWRTTETIIKCMHACVCIYTFIFYWGIEDKLMQWVLKKCLFWIDCSLQHEWVIEVICGRREQCVSKIHGWCWLPTFSCNDSTTQAANCNPDFLVNRVHTSESIHSKVNGSRGIMKWNDAVSIKK